MGSATFFETKGSYSRCWDGHITPKNSKWLQENLTDMDSKIKSMIKLIEEDADSFARRAEMYYMKRPELMKLVKEFYRAYRALAERYDRVTGALRQAHRDIAVAFPNQIQLILPDEPPSELPFSVEAVRDASFMLSYADGGDESVSENNPSISCEECKHLNCLLADEESRKKFTEGLIMKGLLLKEGAGENYELKKFKEELSDLSKENENLKNQIASESMRADKAENESQNFKDTISKLKFQLEAAFLQYKVSQERMAFLEAEISQTREEASHLNDEMSVTVTNLNIAEARCFGLEKENSSLQCEVNKCNETVSRKLEETSNLSKENQNLHNTIKLESMRAQQAEAETCRLTDAIAKLKADLGSSLLQYKVSQERISDLEGEIYRFKDQFQSLNVEMSIRSCELSMAEEQYLVAQEENKSLQFTVDKFKILMEKQEEGVVLREEELCKLKKFIEDEHQSKSCAAIQEKMSLELELSEFKQRITGKEEEIAAKEKELDKLKQSLEEERQWRMSAAAANQTMKKLYSQSEEKVTLMGLEIQSGTELLRRMEISKSGLEEENKRLYDENNDLKEKSFSSASKIVDLQDEINSLRRSKLKITDELSFHLDENKDVQQELSSLKNERQNFEERHNELMEQLVEVNLNAVSLRALVQELLDGKRELKYADKQFEGEKLSNCKYLKLMECLPEKNSFLENSLSELTTELRWLREKIKGLEECCESLHGNAASHSSENAVLVSHAEAVTNNIKKLSEKSTLIENSLSDVIFDFEGLRKEVKALEESCKPLYHQNCFFITEKSNLACQVEKIEQHMENLENRFCAFEGKHVRMENGKDLALYLVEEVKDLLKSTKEDKENHAFFLKNKTCALNNQIHILKERNQIINDVLDEELHKSMKSDIDCFIMLQVLHDINEKNLILSDECQKNMYKLRRAEKLTLELKQDMLTQEKKLALLLEHDEKLSEWIQVMSREFVAKEGSGCSNTGNMEFKSNNMIKFSGYNLLEQLGLSLAELRAHKSDLEQESVTKMREISFLHRKIDELMDINEQLRANLNASNQQKDKLKIELDKMRQKVADLLELQHSFQGKVQTKLFEESECISSTSFDLGEQADYQEEGHESSLEEVIQEHLSSKFRSSDTEKSLEIDQLFNDVQNLHAIANNLGLDIRVINKNMRTLQTENKHLKDLVVSFVTRNSVLLEDNNIVKASEMLEQPMLKLQLKNKNLCTSLEYLMVDLNKANLMREELEKKILFLSEENFHKEDENKFLRQSNENLVVEISRFDKEAEALRKREMNLRTELHRVKDKSRGFEEEIESHILDINAATINEFMFKQKLVELMLKFNSLEARNFLQYEIYSGKVSARNVLSEDLIKRVSILEQENKGLKEELTSYLPLARSLDIDIASLEEQTLSLANDLILNSKRKQGNNLLAPLQRKRFSQSRGKDHVPNVSAGIMELKKLHAKVKQLLKAVTHTERLLTQGGVAFDVNIVSKMRKIKPRRSKGIVRQLETEKKDFPLDVRESKAADRDVELLKINQEVSKMKHEQMTKDIGLDHVLGSLRAGVDIKIEIDEQKAGETMKPTRSNVKEPHNIDITEVERSEIPSSEIVLEKALSVDKLELPMTNDNQSSQVWSKRISETLSSDSLRLSIMLENLEELKKDIQVSEMSGHPSNSAFNDISDQLQISDRVIKELIDINVKLTKMAGNFSSSLDDSKGRCQVLKRVRRASHKIDGVELELENMQCILSKLQEEPQSQVQKASQRKTRFPLKDFIYGKRNDAKPMKRRFCSCIRFNTKGD